MNVKSKVGTTNTKLNISNIKRNTSMISNTPNISNTKKALIKSPYKSNNNITANKIPSTPTNAPGLGNSLFRGQKFIDFQEPFNESIRPIRNTNGNNLRSHDKNEFDREYVDPNDYQTENEKLEQIEMKENIDEMIETEEQTTQYNIPTNGNEHSQNTGFDISNRSSNLQKQDNLFRKSKYFNNLNIPLQNQINSNINTNNTNSNDNSNFNIEQKVLSNPVTPAKESIKPNHSKKSSYIGDDSINYIRPYTNKKHQEYNILDDNKISSDKNVQNVQSGNYNLFSTKANSNNFYNSGNEVNNIEDNNIDFINTLARLKNGMKLDNSFNHNITGSNTNNDDSKSYIKDILEICSGADISKITGNPNNDLEMNNSYYNGLLDATSGVMSPTYHYSNNFFNTGMSENKNKSTSIIQTRIVKESNTPQGLKVDDLIEITNKRKSMISANNLSSNEAYLRRRHLEALTKIEKLKKEKEEKEVLDFKFAPEINKKSKEMAWKNQNNKMETIKQSNRGGSQILQVNHKQNKSQDLISQQLNKSSNILEVVNNNNNYPHSDNKNFDQYNKFEIMNQIDDLIKQDKIEKFNYRDDDTNANTYKINSERDSKLKYKKRRNNSTGSLKAMNINSQEYEQEENEDETEIMNRNVSSKKYNPPSKYELINKKQGTIKLEINNKIYIPNSGNNENNSGRTATTFRPKPTIETPHNKNYILTSNEFVNYGTKPHKSTEIITTNYNLNNPNNDYETNKNFFFSYDSNKINNEVDKINSNNSPDKEDVDRVEINLFDDFSKVKKSDNSNIIRESNNSAKMSQLQLFPVYDNPEFKMEEYKIINNNDDFKINQSGMNSYRGDTESNAEYKYNYNTHLNSRFVSVDNSEVEEYNQDMNKKQNESAQFNLYTNTGNENMTSRPNNPGNSSLNFSKFTNFVGMSEQYSKRIIPTGNNSKVLNGNYYNNILKRKENIISKDNVNFDISNRNMINSFMSNDTNNFVPVVRNSSTNIFISDMENVEKNDNHEFVAEINYANDENHLDKIYNNSNIHLKKMNYFEEKDSLVTTSVLGIIRDRNVIHQIGENYLTGSEDSNFNNIPQHKVEIDLNIDLDDLIKPKLLLKNHFEKPKKNPFTNQMGNKKLSKSVGKINVEKNINTNNENIEAINVTADIKINASQILGDSYTKIEDEPNKNDKMKKENIKLTAIKDKNINNNNLKNVKPQNEKLNSTKKNNNPVRNISNNKNLTRNIKTPSKLNATKNNQTVENNKSISKNNNNNSHHQIQNINTLSPTQITNILNKSEEHIDKILNNNKNNFVIENINNQDYITLDSENNKPKSITYDFEKFSIDIPKTNKIDSTIINKSTNNKSDPSYNFMNELVTNSFKIHRQSQENCQKQINDFLNKMQLSQDEHELNIKKDLKNLNMDESSFSNLMKEGMSSSLNNDYETEMDNFMKKI